MKRRMVIVLLFIIGCVSMLYHKVDASENPPDGDAEIVEQYYPNDYQGFRYPVLPGMSSWPYGNHAEMAEACRIADDVLASMTTEQLIESVLYYPLYADIYAYDDLHESYQTLTAFVPAFAELSHREDRAERLYEYWGSHSEAIMEEQSEWQNDGFTGVRANPFGMLIFLVSQDDFIGGSMILSPTIEQELNRDCNENSQRITTNNRDITPVTFTGAVTREDNGSESVDTPKNHAMTGYFSVSKEYWIGSDGYVHEFTFSQMTTTAQNYLASVTYNQYHLNPYAAASVSYNCHAYVWCKPAGKYTHWVYQFNPQDYVLTTMQGINVGGNLVYCNSYGNSVNNSTVRLHSAVIVSKIYHSVHVNTVVSFNLHSKWGISGEYLHTMENCPYYYYNNSSYVCDRLYYNY